MDREEEMMIHQLMEEEDVTNANVQEHLLIQKCLKQMQAGDQKKASLQLGGSKFERRKAKSP
jgi:hypothetical protein